MRELLKGILSAKTVDKKQMNTQNLNTTTGEITVCVSLAVNPYPQVIIIKIAKIAE